VVFEPTAAGPKPWDSSPKPTGWMRRCWPALAPCSSRPTDLCSAPLWMP
jgi:hypothetical protein